MRISKQSARIATKKAAVIYNQISLADLRQTVQATNSKQQRRENNRSKSRVNKLEDSQSSIVIIEDDQSVILNQSECAAS